MKRYRRVHLHYNEVKIVQNHKKLKQQHLCKYYNAGSKVSSRLMAVVMNIITTNNVSSRSDLLLAMTPTLQY